MNKEYTPKPRGHSRKWYELNHPSLMGKTKDKGTNGKAKSKALDHMREVRKRISQSDGY